MFETGFYETEITPPLGSIIPGGFAARYNRTVTDKLYVRACAVRVDNAQIGILAIDACGLTLDVTNRIKDRVAAHTPFIPEQIMVTFTHTHGGGPTLNWGEEVVRNETYLDGLVNKAADALILAYQKAVPGQWRTGSEQLYGISFIRVYRMQDGSLKTNPGMNNEKVKEPMGEIDPEVTVAVAFSNDKPMGALVNFACHTAVVAGHESSSDFVGVLSEHLKAVYGPDFITLFINGACGNINHINIHDAKTAQKGRHRYMGEKLAEKTASAIEKAKPMEPALSFATDTIKARIRKPSKDMVVQALAHFEKMGDKLADSVPGTPNYSDTFYGLQALTIAADKRATMTVELQLLRLGTITIAGIPCQLFTQFGLAMKQQDEYGCTMVASFANDYLGYVPTPECMKPGVYEARLATTSMLTEETGDAIVDHIGKMRDSLLTEFTIRGRQS